MDNCLNCKDKGLWKRGTLVAPCWNCAIMFKFKGFQNNKFACKNGIYYGSNQKVQYMNFYEIAEARYLISYLYKNVSIYYIRRGLPKRSLGHFDYLVNRYENDKDLFIELYKDKVMLKFN